MTGSSRHNGADWSETPKYLLPRPTPRGPRVLGRRAPRRAAHPALHDVRAAPALPAPAVLALRRATTLEWVTAAGCGTVYSFTVIRQNGVPPFNERVPFVVATRRPRRGRRADDRGDARRSRPSDARIGMRVRADVPARERRVRLRRLRRPESATEPSARVRSAVDPTLALDGRALGTAGRADPAPPARRDRRAARDARHPRPAGRRHRPRGRDVARDLLPVLPRRRGGGARARRRRSATRSQPLVARLVNEPWDASRRARLGARARRRLRRLLGPPPRGAAHPQPRGAGGRRALPRGAEPHAARVHTRASAARSQAPRARGEVVGRDVTGRRERPRSSRCSSAWPRSTGTSNRSASPAPTSSRRPRASSTRRWSGSDSPPADTLPGRDDRDRELGQQRLRPVRAYAVVACAVARRSRTT